MTITIQKSMLRNFGDFLRKEVDVMQVFKGLAVDPGSQKPATRQTTAASSRLRPEPLRGRLLYFPSNRRVGT